VATIRLSVTIPSTLHERLEGLRDRVNVSKVCTIALEKELDMLEARPSIADPKIARLMERIKGSHGLWYDRGHEDGTAWAVDNAKREDLELAATQLAAADGQALLSAGDDDDDDAGGPVLPVLPGLIQPYTAAGQRARFVRRPIGITTWLLHDLGLNKEPQQVGEAEAYKRFTAALATVDAGAYAEGWRDALVELWKAVALALR